VRYDGLASEDYVAGVLGLSAVHRSHDSTVNERTCPRCTAALHVEDYYSAEYVLHNVTRNKYRLNVKIVPTTFVDISQVRAFLSEILGDKLHT